MFENGKVVLVETCYCFSMTPCVQPFIPENRNLNKRWLFYKKRLNDKNNYVEQER